MKDNQKVYIRGVEGRGEEVINALKAVGGKINPDHVVYGDDDQWVYLINHSGFIDSYPSALETGKIIMDNYTELHLPEKWKDGDVLVTGEGLFFVLKGDYQVGDKDATIGAYCCVNEHQVCLSGHFSQIVSPRLASPKEVEHFYELMHKYGKDWDAEKKQVVDLKWEPKENDNYYCIGPNGDVANYTWDGDDIDAEFYNFGNCFKTEEEAKVMAEKVKKLLKGE